MFFSTALFTITIFSLAYYYQFFPQEIFHKSFQNLFTLNIFISDLVKVSLLTLTLFLGYVVQILLSYENFNEFRGTLLFFKSVIYGPLMEEIIYRFIIFEIFKAGGYSNLAANLLASIIFGLSKRIKCYQ